MGGTLTFWYTYGKLFIFFIYYILPYFIHVWTKMYIIAAVCGLLMISMKRCYTKKFLFGMNHANKHLSVCSHPSENDFTCITRNMIVFIYSFIYYDSRNWAAKASLTYSAARAAAFGPARLLSATTLSVVLNSLASSLLLL